MSIKYLNGISYPIIEITDQYGRRVENGSFTLPLTNKVGLDDMSNERYTEYESLGFVYKKKTKGWTMNFVLHYEEYAAKETATKIMQLLGWEYAISNTPSMYNYRIMLTPRADVPSRKFEVVGQNKEMIMKVLAGGVNCIGHSGLVLKYRTKYLSNWQARDPDAEAFIIQDYQNHLII
jgi:hypothetical protein